MLVDTPTTQPIRCVGERMCEPPRVVTIISKEETKALMETITALARERYASFVRDEEEEDGTRVKRVGDDINVVVPDPEALSKKAKHSVPWKRLRSEPMTVAIKAVDVTLCAQDGPCVFCGENMKEGSEVVGGSCSNAMHRGAHLQCWALILSQVPDAHCCGCLKSRCEEMVVTLDREAYTRLRALSKPVVMSRLAAAKKNAAMDREDQRTKMRHVTRAALFEKVLAAVDNDEVWPAHDWSRYAIQGREAIPGSELGGSCLVCNEPFVKEEGKGDEDEEMRMTGEIAAMTCKKHKAHYDCYAFSRLVADLAGVKLPHECPAYLFGNLDCSCTIPIMALNE